MAGDRPIPLTRRNKDQHPAVVDPDTVIVLGDVSADPGSLIGPRVRLGPDAFLTQTSIEGDAVLYNCEVEGALVGSRCTITGRVGDGTTVHPGTVLGQLRVSGEIEPPEVGEGVLLGPGCSVLPGVRIGNDAVVEPGSVVTEDVPPRGVVGGNPAMPRGMVVDSVSLDVKVEETGVEVDGETFEDGFSVEIREESPTVEEDEPGEYGVARTEDGWLVYRGGSSVKVPGSGFRFRMTVPVVRKVGGSGR